MQAVPELTYALLRPLGAPKGRVQTFTEVRLQDAADLLAIPDGAILVDRGKTRWALSWRSRPGATVWTRTSSSSTSTTRAS